MPKRNPPETSPSRNHPKNTHGSRSPGVLSLLLFWPFHLFNLLTRPLPTPLRWTARIIGHPAVLGLYGLLVLAVIYGTRAQRFDLGKIHAMPERSIIFDRQGVEIGRIHGEKRSLVPLDQVSPNFKKAIIAREDERFYQHGAFDAIGIGRAILKNLEGKREGASTITQQLSSDIFQLKRDEKRGDTLRQIDRKFLEIAIAFRLESALTKDEILEAYINQINWGRQIKGIGEASRIYFEKHPSELSLSQGAMLAGIVRGPDAYNPFRSLTAATRERDTTLARMVDAKSITAAEAEAAKKEPIVIRPPGRRENHESYAMDAIRRDLEIILEKENIELGGLDITTTIDMRVQKSGEDALEKKLRQVESISGFGHQTRAKWQKLPPEKRGEPAYIQGAAAVIENRTGAILALIGGRDADESRYNRANQGGRPIGSIFKPFVYLAAFDRGLRPDTQISDGPIQPGEIKGAGNWRPGNSDGTYGGMFPASYGLIRSRNTMSVRVGNYAGISGVKETARQAGFGTKMPERPTSFLGTFDASPLEVATSYTIFPNDGQRYRPYLISEIKDRDGNVLYSTKPLGYPAAKSGSSWSVARILRSVTTSGTAAAVKRLGFDKPCGGKTGTTNDFKDAWFSGYTSSLTCAVWVGFDTPVKTMQGGYGATLALPVWVDIMKTADRLGYKAGDLDSKVKLVEVELCRLSGKRATAGCRENGTAYTDKVPADTVVPSNDFCPIHPARAQAVEENESSPSSAPLRAQPVEESPVPPRRPMRAIPVEE
ncbi:MAG: transglycosylase domain-containing protein [Luteolibacter sp.]